MTSELALTYYETGKKVKPKTEEVEKSHAGARITAFVQPHLFANHKTCAMAQYPMLQQLAADARHRAPYSTVPARQSLLQSRFQSRPPLPHSAPILPVTITVCPTLAWLPKRNMTSCHYPAMTAAVSAAHSHPGQTVGTLEVWYRPHRICLERTEAAGKR